MEMEQKREQFNQLVEKFYERNKVDDKTNEEYLENFRLRVGKFLSQKPLEKDSKVKEIIFNCLKDDYKYYSKSQIAVVLKSFHTRLNNELIKKNQSIDDCYFIDVLNKNTMKNNSSNELITQYLKVNKLSNDLYKHFFRMVDIETKKEYNTPPEDEEKRCKDLLEDKKYLIMIDNYSSTGRTIQHFIEIINKYTPHNIKLIFLCLHMTEKAKKTLTDFCSKEGIDCLIAYHEISKPYFHNNEKNKEMVQIFEKEVVKPRRGNKDILGFRETQSVVTTYRNTPNNTLSLFWSENKKGDGWRPIFLRKDKDGKLGDLHGILELGMKIKWYFRYKKIPKKIEEQLILLTYLRGREKRSITKIEVEISHIICYTDRVIEECEKQGLISITNSCFELSDRGLEKLQEYSLDNGNILKVIKSKFEECGKQKEVK